MLCPVVFDHITSDLEWIWFPPRQRKEGGKGRLTERVISVRSRKGAGSVLGSRASSLTLFSLAASCCLPCCLPALLIDSYQLGLGDRLSGFPLFPIIKTLVRRKLASV